MRIWCWFSNYTRLQSGCGGTWVLDLAVNFQLTSNIAPISSFSINEKQNKILKNLGSNSTHKWNQESSSVSDSSKLFGSATDSKTQHPIFDLIFTNQNQNP
jgi:hypothetical protein